MMLQVTDPRFWFKTTKQLENANRRILAADWSLFTARPHDPEFYPGLASATRCGWHKEACGAPSVWAVVVPLRSANRVGICGLGTLEAEAHFTARARTVDPSLSVEFNFEGVPDESSYRIAEAIVDLHDNQGFTWLRLAELFGIDQQRARRLYDRIEGPEAHRTYAVA